MINKKVKLVTINLAIFFVLLVSIESICFGLRAIQGRPSLGWLYYIDPAVKKAINDPCEKVITHPLLTFVHNHQNKCEIRDGYIDGSFVRYKPFEENETALLALGGSTTDGFFQDISNGYTWPLLLQRILSKKNIPINVINGGVGSYNSNQELLKLLQDGLNLKSNIKYIVSLNGINDIPGYSGLQNDYFHIAPYMTERQLEMYLRQSWIRSDTGDTFFPNIFSALRFIGTKSLFNRRNLISEIKSENIKNRSASDQWFFNVRMMHAIAAEAGAKYYVFIQPTMGVSNAQNLKKDTADYFLYNKMSPEYITGINIFYKEISIKCKELKYCFNISNIAPPIGNLYHDPRHHNEFGNDLIATSIYNKVFSKE